MGKKNYNVYCHTNKINGMKYVGVTSQKLHRRFRNGDGYSGCPHFHNAIQKYGWEEFNTEVVFENLTREQAEYKEVYLISKWNTLSPNGYNLSTGGSLNSEVTEVTLKKISDSRSNISINQYTLDGEFIKHWETVRDASLEIKVSTNSIRECCKRNNKTCMGYIFRYDWDELYNQDDIRQIEIKDEWDYYSNIAVASPSTKSRMVKCINTNEIFNSLSEATQHYNTSRNMISKCCQGKASFAGKHNGQPLRWRYINEH